MLNFINKLMPAGITKGLSFPVIYIYSCAAGFPEIRNLDAAIVAVENSKIRERYESTAAA